MDIKTRLEDDVVLFSTISSPQSRAQTLKTLNSIGIYTIEDFINYKVSDYPATSRNVYCAMAHIFRNAYLGKDLIYDVILEKEYNKDQQGFQECASDIIRIGLSKNNKRNLAYYLENEFRNSDDFSMESLIRSNAEFNYNSGPDIRRYYIKYMDDKKKVQQPEEQENISNISNNDAAILTTLKIQVQTLIAMKEDLEKQIDVLQSKISTLEGGQISHGRK